MAEKQRTDRDKAEGERWTSDPDTVEVADRYKEGIGDTDEGTGGISNRPLSEEVSRQHNLPDRGTSKREEAGEGDVEQ
jgi:hypothetical protein